MTDNEVEELQSGDCVFWHDPDEGKLSRVYVIEEISLDYDRDSGEITMVSIQEPDGSELECLASELDMTEVEA